MFHMDVKTAVTSRPAVKPLVSKQRRYYTNGNPAMGVPATIVDCDHLNTMMVELLNVVEAAGVEPDKLDDAQLLQAFRILIAKATGREEWDENVVTVGGMIPVGQISHLPQRYNMLPPGWIFCNGERFLTESAVGKALLALPDEFRSDWKITVVGGGVNVPDLFSDGKGLFIRSVDGVTRLPGSLEADAMRLITAKTTSSNSTSHNLTASSSSSHSLRASSNATSSGGGGVSSSGSFPAPYSTSTGGFGDSWTSGPFSFGSSQYRFGEASDSGSNHAIVKQMSFSLSAGGSAPSVSVTTTISGGITTSTTISGGISVATNSNTTLSQSGTVADENRPMNVGMTPAIYLGV